MHDTFSIPAHRCGWVTTSVLYQKYHDEEWGVPLYDSKKLFEFLILEGAQAGLSWSTILNKREHYRQAFANFDPTIMAKFSQKKVEALLQNNGLVRNRLKINAAITNAKAYLQLAEAGVDFSEFLWKFVNHRPIKNAWSKLEEVPARTEQSDAMARELKKLGFKFVGSTICYALMQAVGMVNDHITTCFRYSIVNQL